MSPRRLFTLVVIATIALPIAANTVVYAVVRAILLDPLPLPQSEALVRIEQLRTTGTYNLSGATFADVRARSRSFAAVAAFRTSPATISNGTQAIQATATSVTSDYALALGIRPVAGRLPDERDFAGSGAPVVFVSLALWSRLFGSDSSAIGRSILVNAVPKTIAGVLDVPLSAPGAADVWLPYSDTAPLFRNRRAQLYTTIARLVPDVTAAAANAELDSIARQIRTDAPDAGADLSLTVTPLKARIGAAVRRSLLALWMAVALLLLIAAANVANLMSMERAGRARELSIRAALGASRGRLVRHLAAEAALLALAGGAAGTVLGAVGVDAIKPLLPAMLPRTSEIVADARLIAYGLALSVAAVMTFGIWPAIAASGRDATAILRTRDGGETSRLRDVFVAAQVAMTLALLAGAAVLGRSFAAAARVPLGVDPDRIITADVSLPGGRYGTADAHARFYASVLEQLARSSDLTHVAVTGALPLSPTAATTMVAQDGREDGGGDADVVTASPALPATLHIPLVRGRLFIAGDRRASQPVAIVNETAARRLWSPGVDPIGRTIQMRDWGAPYTATVVGIVGDVRQNGPDQPVDPIVYYPLAQFPETTISETIVAVSSAPLPRVVEQIRNAVARVDADQPIARIALMTDRIATALAPRRFNFVLLAVFAASALLLAGVGIYGAVAFAMAARTREIGVRVALGAAPRHIARLVLARGLIPVIAGLFAGLMVSILVARSLQGLVFGVPPSDPASLASAAAVMAGCALLAIAPAAWRAVTVDPVGALRGE
jgi:predicted permease